MKAEKDAEADISCGHQKKSFTCTHVSNSDGDSWWFSFVLNIHIYIYVHYSCCIDVSDHIYILILILILIYIYINTNMNINIIDYNGISIWTMCSKTKSWKTHYVTRGLGAPLFQFLSLTSPSFVALNLPSLSNPSQKRSGSKAETERTPWYIPQCLNTTGSYKIHLCAAWSDQSIHPHLKPTSYIYTYIYIYLTYI